MSVDLATIARDLKTTPEKVDTTVQLLDDGNTIPFITRFRKDETGGLNEKQIHAIKQYVRRKRTLEERKEFILKSIDSQGKLTDQLKADIAKANTARYLEDLYLPFKPKKQSLAMTARQQGLEPLANEFFEGKTSEVDLAAHATDFVRVDKGLASVDDVIAGVSHLIIERFSENRQLRSELRKILWNTGQLVCKKVESEPLVESSTAGKPETTAKNIATVAEPQANQADDPKKTGDATATKAEQPVDHSQPVDTVSAALPVKPTEQATPQVAGASEPNEESKSQPATEPVAPATENDSTATAESIDKQGAANPAEPKTAEVTPAATEVSPAEVNPAATEVSPAEVNPAATTASPAEAKGNEAGSTGAAEPAKKKKKKKKKKTAPDPFKDYVDYKQPLKNLPHHRILAINRGERAGKLKASIDIDQKLVAEKTAAILVPTEHPSKLFMEKCALDAVTKSVIPSLEREARRELTEAAEKHAVEVFASNLKNLLLQPPFHDRKILAIDPGFKRGCTIAAIDETGNVLETGQIYVVGNQKRREESAEKIQQWITKHSINTIAIGNGAACRETEQMVSDLLGSKLAGRNVKYIILNEAGASTYSTSEIGREELPDLSPTERSAVSIGRRLLDPLSELVKISPANIGVGMYQHDVKAKHLSESLDEVVQFCVNRVGVNVNTASPSLLKYVSGLNQLTARRIYEHRNEKGAFRNREQLKEVTGLGEATFVQAAGFMRIHDGDQPLDGTSIHPESYEVATKILEKIGASAEKLLKTLPPIQTPNPPTPQPIKEAPVAVATDTSKAEDADAAEQLAGRVSTELSSETTEEQTTPAQSPTATEPPTVTEAQPESAVEPQTEQAPTPASPPEVKPTGDAVNQPIETDAASTDAPPSTQPAAKPAPREQRRHDPERAAIVAKLKELKIEDLAKELSVGNHLIRDIVKTFSQPRRDPRDGVSKPIFRDGIIKTDDLKVDMQLDAQVVNVVDFGVFVDIGLGESSLIHVSQLSNRFIRNPHQFFSIGDVVKVWVTEVDGERRRVKLTAIKPGTPKFDPSKTRNRRGKKPDRAKPAPNRGKFKGSSGHRGKPAHARTQRSTRRPPKPVKPITKEMLEGKEPMRSFSDLLQFVEKKPSDSTDKNDES